MQCKTVLRQSSSYLDGDLSAEKSAVIRGHLRCCDSCNQAFEDESSLIDAAATLGPMDPPDRIWQAIQSQISEEEIADSKRGWMQTWLLGNWRPVAVMAAGAVLAAGLVFVVLPMQKRAQSDAAIAAGESSPLQVAGRGIAEESHREERSEELVESKRHYLQTIAELREILEEDRAVWSAEAAGQIDEELLRFAAERNAVQLTITSGLSDVRAGDEAFASYQGEIDFLQLAISGEAVKVGSL